MDGPLGAVQKRAQPEGWVGGFEKSEVVVVVVGRKFLQKLSLTLITNKQRNCFSVLYLFYSK